MNDNIHLLVLVVLIHHNGVVLPRVVAGIRSVLHAVGGSKVGTLDLRRIPAALDVHQEDGVFDVQRLERRIVVDVFYKNLEALVHITCAALLARTPGTVEDPGLGAVGDGHARHRVGVEVRGERGDGRIHVQRHQEQQGRASGHSGHGKQRGGVEPNLLLARSFHFLFLFVLGELEKFLFSKLLLRIKQKFRASTTHRED